MKIFSLSYLINQFLLDLLIIMSVAFYTLLERKLLSYNQNRKGPNKISFLGLVQPISDALKLLSKKEFKLIFSNNFYYWIPPFYSFFLLVMLLNFIPNKYNTMNFKYSWLLFFCFIAFMGFSTILMGWSSNSKYTLLGSLRSLAQTISYEVILILIIFMFIFFFNTFSFNIVFFNKLFFFIMLLFFVVFLIISLVCEVNRAPFDLAEGESELVSGFNTEYGMTKFSLIFLTEYGMMIVMSFIMVFIFNNYFMFFMFFKILMMMILFLWFRSSYPRVRYDFLMYLTWKNLLYFILIYSIFFLLIL